MKEVMNEIMRKQKKSYMATQSGGGNSGSGASVRKDGYGRQRDMKDMMKEAMIEVMRDSMQQAMIKNMYPPGD